jgi:hypothetical protein
MQPIRRGYLKFTEEMLRTRLGIVGYNTRIADIRYDVSTNVFNIHLVQDADQFACHEGDLPMVAEGEQSPCLSTELAFDSDLHAIEEALRSLKFRNARLQVAKDAKKF